MKNFTLLSIFLGCLLGHAQTQIVPTVTQTDTNWTTTLQNLNNSGISSGVLYDKVTPYSNLLSFNRSDFNTADNSYFRQAISELYRASDKTKFIAPEFLGSPQSQTAAGKILPGNPPVDMANVISIGIINTTLQKLNFNENTPADGGLTYSNNMLYPIAGKPSFVTKKVLIASPLKDYISGTTVNFNFSSNLIFTNAASAIKTLTVDFGNNQVSTVIQNGNIITPSVTISYTSKGMKTIKFTALFADNSTMETYGKFYFNYVSAADPEKGSIACNETLKEKGIFTSKIPYQGTEESSPVFGKIEYNIFYNYNNAARKILKPIVIIDGFDPGDVRRVLDCDCAADPACALEYDDDDNGIFNTLKHRSIEDMMNYTVKIPQSQDVITKNLIDELRKKDYDVIIINNPTYTTQNVAGRTVTIDGGADYIERNAMNLVSYLQDVKTSLVENASSEKIVIVGPSMGGQISRYALAYMDKKFAETNNLIWQHNTRLWISVDSPHLGANIPLSTQASVYWLGYVTGEEDGKKNTIIFLILQQRDSNCFISTIK